MIRKTPHRMRQGSPPSIATETESTIPDEQYKTKATGIVTITIILKVYVSLLLVSK